MGGVNMRIIYDDPIEQGIRDILAGATPEERARIETILTPSVLAAIKEAGWACLDYYLNIMNW
jgi:hypothetical protein